MWLIEPKELATVDDRKPHHIYGYDNEGYHPLEELITEMDEVKKKQKTGVTD